jgi:hypothetical protein
MRANTTFCVAWRHAILSAPGMTFPLNFPGRILRRLLPPAGGQILSPLSFAVVDRFPAEPVFVQDAEKVPRPGRTVANGFSGGFAFPG